MLAILGGIGVFAVTSVLFWCCMPKGESGTRLTHPRWDPLIVPLFVTGWAFALVAVLSATLSLFGPR